MDSGSATYEPDHIVTLITAIGPRRARCDQARLMSAEPSGSIAAAYLQSGIISSMPAAAAQPASPANG